MNSFFLQLLGLSPIAIAMPVIDTGMGDFFYGPESVVTDFAVLSGGTFDNNPPVNITICSSTTSGGAFSETMSPFQLIHENGDPWISFLFYTDLTDHNVTGHHILLFVSSIFLF